MIGVSDAPRTPPTVIIISPTGEGPGSQYMRERTTPKGRHRWRKALIDNNFDGFQPNIFWFMAYGLDR